MDVRGPRSISLIHEHRLPKAIVSRLIGRYLFSGSSQINLHDRSFTVGRNSFSVIYKYVRRGDTRVDCVVRLLQVNATTVQFVNGKPMARTFSTNCVRVKIHQVSDRATRRVWNESGRKKTRLDKYRQINSFFKNRPRQLLRNREHLHYLHQNYASYIYIYTYMCATNTKKIIRMQKHPVEVVKM